MNRGLYRSARLVSGARYATAPMLVGIGAGAAAALIGRDPTGLYQLTEWIFGEPTTGTLSMGVRYALMVIGGLVAVSGLIGLVAAEVSALSIAARWAASPDPHRAALAALDARNAKTHAALRRLTGRAAEPRSER